jgi:hypothetical protein
MFEHSLKNAYIGEVWTPWANTIAYFPFTSVTTVNDMKGSGTAYNLTNNWCSFWTHWGVDSLLLSWTGNTDHILTGDMWDISAYSHTINIWAYATGITNSNWWILFRWEWNDNYKWGAEIISRPSYIRYAYWWDDLDSTNSYSTGGWHNIVAIFDKSSSKQYLYIDGQAIGNRTTTYTHSLRNNNFYVWAGYNYYNPSAVARWNWYLSELIVENRIWNADEIQAYYNSTKSNYWL